MPRNLCVLCCTYLLDSHVHLCVCVIVNQFDKMVKLFFQFSSCYKNERTIVWFWECRNDIKGIEIKGIKFSEAGQGMAVAKV